MMKASNSFNAFIIIRQNMNSNIEISSFIESFLAS